MENDPNIVKYRFSLHQIKLRLLLQDKDENIFIFFSVG